MRATTYGAVTVRTVTRKKLLSSSLVLRVDENDVRQTSRVVFGRDARRDSVESNGTGEDETRKEERQTLNAGVRTVVLVERVLDGGIESGNFNGKSSGGVRGSETGVDENGAKR